MDPFAVRRRGRRSHRGRRSRCAAVLVDVSLGVTLALALAPDVARGVAVNEGSDRVNKGAVRRPQARPLALRLLDQLRMRQHIELRIAPRRQAVVVSARARAGQRFEEPAQRGGRALGALVE